MPASCWSMSSIIPPKPVPQARPQVAVHNAGDKSGDNQHGVSNEELRHKTKITLKKRRNCRCLLAQMSRLDAKSTSQGTCMVAELFSPPRFSLEGQKRGYHGVAYDIKDGYDLDDPKVQDQIDIETR